MLRPPYSETVVATRAAAFKAIAEAALNAQGGVLIVESDFVKNDKPKMRLALEHDLPMEATEGRIACILLFLPMVNERIKPECTRVYRRTEKKSLINVLRNRGRFVNQTLLKEHSFCATTVAYKRVSREINRAFL